jgi:hypothetical protein
MKSNGGMMIRFVNVALLIVLVSCAPSDPEQPDAELQKRVETALQSTQVRILEQQLARIPENTPGRDRVVAHLEELRRRDREATAREQVRLHGEADKAIMSRKKILSSLKSDKDEFQKATFYQHPGTPVLGTQMYLYIAEVGDHYTLRLVAIYQGEDWVFWDKLLIKVGDDVVTLDAGRSNVKRENSSGTVWETLDLPVASASVGATQLNFTELTTPVFATLMKADSASMRFQGESVRDHKLSNAELARFKEIGKKYMALFGITD